MAWTMSQDVKFMKWESLFADIAMVGTMNQQASLMEEANQRLAMEQEANARMRAAMTQDQNDQRWWRFSMWREQTPSGRAYNAWENQATWLMREMDQGAWNVTAALETDLNNIAYAKAQTDPRWKWAVSPGVAKALPKRMEIMYWGAIIALIVVGLPTFVFTVGGELFFSALGLLLCAGLGTWAFVLNLKIENWRKTHIDPTRLDAYLGQIRAEYDAIVRRSAPSPLMAWGGADAVDLYGTILNMMNEAPFTLPQAYRLPPLPQHVSHLTASSIPQLMPNVRAALSAA
ncbi:hypothetical protein [Bifidobacterium parmae]|uniref:Uncharacterized protein n=1 Tax=Bifidobacterium parmae TaxID=361854 RepID=A0A2N5J4Q2_9BIFI|nr:hypothetical protein [Bifidobacterium parmae]PLS29173.1 hypothetical protein Uis4E_0751 [Bifidobacterium parmae]